MNIPSEVLSTVKPIQSKAIQVIDAPCGTGKTSWAIQHMKENPHKQYLFITPFLTETERIKTECSVLDFVDPSDDDGTKGNHLKKLLGSGQNIVCTHSLFSYVDEEIIEQLRTSNYTLILDEVMDIMHQEPVSPHDLLTLKKNYLTINEESGKAGLTEDGLIYTGRFEDIIEYARHGRLYCFGGTFLMWQFPPQVFSVINEMYLLTYLFRGQIQRCYLDFHQIPYEMHDVSKSKANRYSLTDYNPIKSDENFRRWLKGNLNIYKGKLNLVIKSNPNFTWYRDRKRRELKPLKNATYNYFFNIIKGKADENMWTTFKDWEKVLKGKGYTDGFISHNIRATNDYAHKRNLAYLIDRRLNPGMVRYLQTREVQVDEELFSISELIQWVFRPAIRNGNPVNLYLPSNRMRRLLTDWMDAGCAMQRAA